MAKAATFAILSLAKDLALSATYDLEILRFRLGLTVTTTSLIGRS